MKGIAIHVEQLIIIIIAVLVLLALITFFLGVWNPSTIVYMGYKNTACAKMQANGCATELIDTSSGSMSDSGITKKQLGTGSGTASVQDVCTKLGYTSVDQCRKSCACMTES
ncbi:MAG: hypothetical protein NTW30_01550 [Candidatus Aenigmarchaeota archaeon]|nr:hypothetical protein [Candidatus Aenigmarchaeota archaeon]